MDQDLTDLFLWSMLVNILAIQTKASNHFSRTQNTVQWSNLSVARHIRQWPDLFHPGNITSWLASQRHISTLPLPAYPAPDLRPVVLPSYRSAPLTGCPIQSILPLTSSTSLLLGLSFHLLALNYPKLPPETVQSSYSIPGINWK